MLDPVELVGYAGTAFTITAYAMKSSIWLRLAGIASSLAFLTYGALIASYPVMVMELIILPLNIVRLVELTAPKVHAEGGRTAAFPALAPARAA